MSEYSSLELSGNIKPDSPNTLNEDVLTLLDKKDVFKHRQLSDDLNKTPLTIEMSNSALQFEKQSVRKLQTGDLFSTDGSTAILQMPVGEKLKFSLHEKGFSTWSLESVTGEQLASNDDFEIAETKMLDNQARVNSTFVDEGGGATSPRWSIRYRNGDRVTIDFPLSPENKVALLIQRKTSDANLSFTLSK